jgi:hypothetical protein
MWLAWVSWVSLAWESPISIPLDHRSSFTARAPVTTTTSASTSCQRGFLCQTHSPLSRLRIVQNGLLIVQNGDGAPVPTQAWQLPTISVNQSGSERRAAAGSVGSEQEEYSGVRRALPLRQGLVQEGERT